MTRQLVFVTLVSLGIAAVASAHNPLSKQGPFVPGEAGLEIRDTGLLVRDTDLDVAALYHSCGKTTARKLTKHRLEWLARRGLLVTADDVPVAHTPGCGYEEFPEPVLESCNEPLARGVPDLRGLWVVYQGLFKGHAERIEQCGNRVVITGGGVIHDMRADGTLANGVNDVNALNCSPISVAAEFVDGSLELRPNDSFVAVTRKRDGEELVWTLLGIQNRLIKICDLGPCRH